MSGQSERKLDRLLREAYPAVEVSPDFTLRLWRRLMKEPAVKPWLLPVPVVSLAAAAGFLIGILVWGQLGPFGRDPVVASAVNQVARLDLFGNAPFDTLAGSYLKARQDQWGVSHEQKREERVG